MRPDPRFAIGHDTEACTRGIWLWAAPAAVWPGAAGPAGARLLLMDSEGLASTEQVSSASI
jgi:hypothetical protein